MARRQNQDMQCNGTGDDAADSRRELNRHRDLPTLRPNLPPGAGAGTTRPVPRGGRHGCLAGLVLSGFLLATSAVAAPKISLYQGGTQSGHYLTWNGKPVLLIGDSVTQGWMEGGSNFNQTAYVDALASRGLNLLLLWSFIGTDAAQQQGDARIGYDAPELWPWAGSTDANTMDLLTFNQAYFDRFKALVAYAESKGIAVIVQVHDGWTKTRFAGHPYNAANGNGPLTANSQFVELADYANEMPATFNAAWTRQQKNQYFQERFAAKLISELDAYANVLYEMFNEGEWYNTTQRHQHEQHFLAFFRARCTNLLLSNADHITGDSPHSDSKVDLISLHSTPWTGKFATFQTGFNTTPAKPYLESEPVPEFNGTTPTLAEVRQSVWERALAGAGWVNQNDASFGWDPNAAIAAQAANRNLAYDYAGHCARFFNGTNADVQFWNMQPNSALATTGICLARAGVEYVVYSPGGASFGVNLSANTGPFTVRWYNPRTGQTATNANVNGGSTSQLFTKPDTNDWTLHLKTTASSTAAITVEGNGVVIANGDNAPGTSDHTDFGGMTTVTGTVTRVFSIRNSGLTELAVSNVVLTGSADFALTAAPAPSVSPGGSTTFNITFDPSANGLRAATVAIANSDTNSNPYTFAIQGTGTSPRFGLVGWWRLNETNGTSAKDSSGNNLHGTLFNGPVWTAGRFGNGLSVDGSNDYVDMGDPAGGTLDFSAGQSFSYGAWFKPALLDATSRRLLSKRNGTGPANVGYDLGVTTTTLTAELADGAVEAIASTTAISLGLNEWHHTFVVVDRGASQLRLYFNGVEKLAVSLSGFGATANATAFNLGRVTGDSTRSFAGVLDDARVYNRALGAAEVAALFNPPTPVFLPPTLAGGELTLNWIGDGQLESAAQLTGPWQAILPPPAPPYSVTITSGDSRFFRLNASL